MFHRLQKVLERAKADNDDTAIQRAEAELAEIGGLEIYQVRTLLMLLSSRW